MNENQVRIAISIYETVCTSAFDAMIKSIANHAINTKGDVRAQAERAADMLAEFGVDDIGEHQDIVRGILEHVHMDT